MHSISKSIKYDQPFIQLIIKYLETNQRSKSWLARKISVHHSTIDSYLAGDTKINGKRKTAILQQLGRDFQKEVRVMQLDLDKKQSLKDCVNF